MRRQHWPILSGLYLILEAILSFGLGGYLAGRLRAAGATVARATVAKMLLVPGYLPFVSTLCFSSSFIFLMVGSRLASPVVWVVVLGGLAFGKEDCPGGVLAGRVAVAAGGDVACAVAACVCNKNALDRSKAASAVELDFIDLTPVESIKTVGAN
jgi:hypothetical protein